MQNQKFKIGDKVRRKVYGHTECPLGYVGTVTSIHGSWLSVDNKVEGTDSTPFSERYFELVETIKEKQMFDLKKNPWYITTDTPEKRIAAQEWLFQQGIYWRCEDSVVKGWDFAYLTNVNSCSGIEQGFMHGSGNPINCGKEIKLTFETKVVSAEYPETLTEKQKEIKAIREEQENLAKAQQELAARLKKLEETE